MVLALQLKFRIKGACNNWIYFIHKHESAGINQSVMMEIRLQERKARIQDYCMRHKRDNDTVLGNDLHYFDVFRSRKVIYCFIPKVSSSHWKKELSSLVREDKQIYKGSLKNTLSQFPRREVKQMLKGTVSQESLQNYKSAKTFTAMASYR